MAGFEAPSDTPTEVRANVRVGQYLRDLGRTGEAVDAYRRAQELAGSDSKELATIDPPLDEVEREALLEARLPALFGGSDHPSSATEAIAFARLCWCKSLYVAAARLYSDAFALDPKLNQADMLHPNPAGVDVIVAKTLPAVEQLLGPPGTAAPS